MDCIEHFKAMQGCFREWPDVYGGELEGEEYEEEGLEGALGEDGEGDAEMEGEVLRPRDTDHAAKASTTGLVSETNPSASTSTPTTTPATSAAVTAAKPTAGQREETEEQEEPGEPTAQSEGILPRRAHDAREERG